MSLFSLITWWSGQVSDSNRELDGVADSILVMCVNRFNSFESTSSNLTERDTIFVGSSTGMLSIYQPTNVLYVTGHQSPTDVILECQLNEPIIDIKCGKFAITKTDRYSIAILHPSRIVCYNVAFAEGLAEYGKQFKLIESFECNLSKAAFSICQGPFGGVKSKEFFCVNYLAKNSLSFFEQDGFASDAVVLPGDHRTLPSRMLYLSRIDCFAVISCPDDILECYKYQDLTTSTSQNPTAPVWTFCVGEFVLEMATHQTTNSESVILILGEHSLICLTDTGLIKFIKKLDYMAITFHSFVIGYYFEPDARLMIAIASDMESLFVYEAGNSVAGPVNCKLIWSTQLPFVPVALSRANFEGMPGGLVLLGPTGQVKVAFFGTDPQIFKVAPLTNTEDTVPSVKRELDRLEADIKQGIDFTDVSFINAATHRDLHVTMHVRPTLLPCMPNMLKNLPTEIAERVKMVKVQFKLTPRIPFDQIQIAINPPPPLVVNERNTIMFERVDAEECLEWEFWIYIAKPQDPQSLSVPVVLSLINRQGIPRIIEKSLDLPPQFLLTACAPQKEAKCKLTIKGDSSANKEILDLFPEFAMDTINQQAIGLKSLVSGEICTIVLGKNSNRYRVHSDNPAIMPIILDLLIQRICQKAKPTSLAQSSITEETPNRISINQTYFVEQLVATIQEHVDCRNTVKRWDKDIEKKSRQMRLFQRKLFLRLQQDPPHHSYNSAAKLLRLTHADLTALQEQLLGAVDRLRQSQLILGNHLRLINLLVIHHPKMPQQIKDNLVAAFICPINDWIEMSWEESLAPAIEMISHVGPLGKKQGIGDIEDVKSFAALPFDMERFQKNLRMVLEKVEGAGLGENEFGELKLDNENIKDVPSTSDWLDEEVTSVAGIEEEEDNIPSVNDMDQYVC